MISETDYFVIIRQELLKAENQKDFLQSKGFQYNQMCEPQIPRKDFSQSKKSFVIKEVFC